MRNEASDQRGPVPVDDRLNAFVDRHCDEIVARRLIVRIDIEPELVLDWPASSEGMTRLIGLAIATLPDGCELMLSASRSPERMSRVGSGVITLRWQLGRSESVPAGASCEDGRGSVVPMGAAFRSVDDLVSSGAIRRIRTACRESGLEFTLEPVGRSAEVIARVYLGTGAASSPNPA